MSGAGPGGILSASVEGSRSQDGEASLSVEGGEQDASRPSAERMPPGPAPPPEMKVLRRPV